MCRYVRWLQHLSWPRCCGTLVAMNMDVDDFLQLEREVWDALVEGDAEADIVLLAEDFLGVYPTGFASRSDHVEQLADGPSVSTYALSEPRKLDVSDRLSCCRTVLSTNVYLGSEIDAQR